jgi:hypothetical protein
VGARGEDLGRGGGVGGGILGGGELRGRKIGLARGHHLVRGPVAVARRTSRAAGMCLSRRLALLAVAAQLAGLDLEDGRGEREERGARVERSFLCFGPACWVFSAFWAGLLGLFCVFSRLASFIFISLTELPVPTLIEGILLLTSTSNSHFSGMHVKKQGLTDPFCWV